MRQIRGQLWILNFLDNAFPLVRPIQLCLVFEFYAKFRLFGLRKIQKFKTLGQSKAKVANKFRCANYVKWIQRSPSDHLSSYGTQSNTAWPASLRKIICSGHFGAFNTRPVKIFGKLDCMWEGWDYGDSKTHFTVDLKHHPELLFRVEWQEKIKEILENEEIQSDNEWLNDKLHNFKRQSIKFDTFAVLFYISIRSSKHMRPLSYVDKA